MLNRFNLFQIISGLTILLWLLAGATGANAQTVSLALIDEIQEPPFIIQITGPAQVNNGDTFLVEIIASDIPEPGMFGYQLELDWDDTIFSLVDGSLALSPDFPVVARLDVGDGLIQVAASREGDVDDLTGPLTLLSAEFQAQVVTEPDSASFNLMGVKVGRKGGNNVPVAQIIGLNVMVLGQQTGSIAGNVKVQGRADDNQAGHAVDNFAGLLTMTDSFGDFVFESVEFGLYTLTASHPGFLAATCTDLSHQSELTVLASVTLLAGDIDDSGEIDVADAVAIGAVFGSTTPGETANLNDDPEVDVLDLILMAANFGQTSAGNPWICQP